MTAPEIFYTVDPPRPELTHEQRVEWFIGAAMSEIKRALADGIVVDYQRRTKNKDSSDLEITITVRHKSAIPGWPAE